VARLTKPLAQSRETKAAASSKQWRILETYTTMEATPQRAGAVMHITPASSQSMAWMTAIIQLGFFGGELAERILNHHISNSAYQAG
jgi:hypothetical protein